MNLWDIKAKDYAKFNENLNDLQKEAKKKLCKILLGI